MVQKLQTEMEKDAIEGGGWLSVTNQPHLSAESSLVALAKMFKSFMWLHIQRDRRLAEEGKIQEQKSSVLTHVMWKLTL